MSKKLFTWFMDDPIAMLIVLYLSCTLHNETNETNLKIGDSSCGATATTTKLA